MIRQFFIGIVLSSFGFNFDLLGQVFSGAFTFPQMSSSSTSPGNGFADRYISDLCKSNGKDQLNQAKWDRYLKLAETALRHGRLKEAKEAVNAMLQIFPQRTLDIQAVSIELYNLYQQFQVERRLQYGFRAGFNRSDIFPVQSKFGGSETLSPNRFKSRMGIQLVGGAEVFFRPRWFFGWEAKINYNRHSTEDTLFRFLRIYSTQQNWQSFLPLSIGFFPKMGRWSMYGRLGIAFGYLWSGKGRFFREDLRGNLELLPSPIEDLKPFRQVGRSYAFSGFGLQLETGKFQLTAEFRYNWGLSKEVKVTDVFDGSATLPYEFYFFDQQYRRHQAEISLGISGIRYLISEAK